MADRPWESQGGIEVGSIDLAADMPLSPADVEIAVPALAQMKGKHAIYLKFTSDVPEKSICILNNLKFE